MRLIALITITISVIACRANTVAGSESSVASIVKSLGPDTTVEDIKKLRSSPREAVELLINNLQTIAENKILPAERAQHAAALRVIWSIRALRYLTGQEFRAPTSHVFGSDEDERTRAEQLRLEAKDSTVPFFSTWMSRDSTYVAPSDAQRKIISAWRSWFRQHRQDWKMPSAPDINQWYF